jgi:hypothetical protein
VNVSSSMARSVGSQCTSAHGLPRKPLRVGSGIEHDKGLVAGPGIAFEHRAVAPFKAAPGECTISAVAETLKEAGAIDPHSCPNFALGLTRTEADRHRGVLGRAGAATPTKRVPSQVDAELSRVRRAS